MTNENKNLVQCETCGEWFDPEEMTDTVDGMVCERCLDEYFYCEDCDAYVNEYDVVVVNKDTRYEFYVCSDCANRHCYQCEECNEWFSDEYINETADGRYVCQDCLDCGNHWRYCENCSKIVHSDDWNYDCDCCEDCVPSARLNGYGYKPEPIFFDKGEEERKLYLGVELEVDKGYVDDFLNSVCNIEEIYCKYDGSLDNGAEIVSHPCTIGYHRELWDEIIEAAKKCGFTSHDARTCGLHVHMNRDYFGETEVEQDLNIAKLILIVNRFWQSHLLRFSRRTEWQLNSWAALGDNIEVTEKETPESVSLKIKDKKANEGRYRAVNLQNVHTVELRFFRGTLRKESFYAALELAQALAELAVKTPLKDVDKLTWQDVIDAANSENFVSYCKYRNLKTEDCGKSVLARVNNHHSWDLKCGDIVRVSPEANLREMSICEPYACRMSGKYGIVVEVRDNRSIALEIPDFPTFYVKPDNIDRVFPC